MRLFRLSLAKRALDGIYSTTTDLYSLKPSKTQ
ncbi:hypothetical protein T4B_14902 [Trichinella pseudospiralis]|uniref:Uncharacterized protein n=1 Tax=Trichinella pseudospiralis TaxID=6337 RepID=A0A0V1G6P3_TRIPS|nr:hypothetical protein T4B_14902 [Trichinella pseudospiralis]